MSLSKKTYGYVVDPFVPFTDENGRTISNGYLKVFKAGTTTPVVTYSNYDGAMNEETIELDNSGRCASLVIASNEFLYKVCLYDAEHSQETPLATIDNIAVAIFTGDYITSTGVTPGTYTKVSVNRDGLVTEGGGLEVSDVPDLPISKITSGTLNPSRIGEKTIDNSKLADGSVNARTIDISSARNLVAGDGIKIEVDNLDVTIKSLDQSIGLFQVVQVDATYPSTNLNIQAGKSYNINLDSSQNSVNVYLTTSEEENTLHTTVRIKYSGDSTHDVHVFFLNEFYETVEYQETISGAGSLDLAVDIRKVHDTSHTYTVSRVWKCL